MHILYARVDLKIFFVKLTATWFLNKKNLNERKVKRLKLT